MADNARLFQEMQDADSLRATMRATILARAHDTLQGLYGSALAKELVSGVHDGFRRTIEQGWFGKDVFDGRWASERPDGHALDGTQQGYGQQLYGWARDQDTARDQDMGR